MTAIAPHRLDAPKPLAAWLAAGSRASARSTSDTTLRLRRAWPRAADHTLLEYRCGRHGIVAGQWFADDARAEAVARATAQASGGLALACGHVLLQAAGADRRLTGLANVLRHRGAELLSHRPERRAVVRIGFGEDVRYAKVMRPERVARSIDVARRLDTARGFTTPRMLSSDPRQGVTVWSALPGTSLYDLLSANCLVEAARLSGQALRGLHAAPLVGLPLHTAAHERDVVAVWMAHVRAHHPVHAGALEGPTRTVDRLLRQLPGAPVVPVHRDWYDKQVFVGDDGTIGMLDFDTLALGDPAIDLANALVHFELRALQGTCAPTLAQSAAEALIAGYAPDAGLTARLPAYTAATRVRLACVYRFRPQWTSVSRRLAERAAQPATPLP